MKSEEKEQIATELHSAAIHLLRTVRTHDNALGIGPAQLSALSVIVFGGPLSLTSLARAEQVRPPTMSRIVDALVRDKLVKRETSMKDRRAVVISPTEKGTKLMHEGRDRRVKQLLRLFDDLSEDEIQQLEKATAILSRILG